MSGMVEEWKDAILEEWNIGKGARYRVQDAREIQSREEDPNGLEL
jgi:hypothetical protein